MTLDAVTSRAFHTVTCLQNFCFTAAMPPAAAAPRKRIRKRKRRRDASISDSSDSSDASASDEEVQEAAVVQPKLKATQVVPMPSESESESDSSTSDDSDSDASAEHGPAKDTHSHLAPETTTPSLSIKPAKKRTEAPPVPPAPIPTIMPKDISTTQEKEKEQLLKERFRKFWMESMADGFADELDEVRKVRQL